MLVAWAKFMACVDDSMTVYEYLRERGKIVAEDLDLNPPKNIEDIDKDWPV